MNLFLIIVIFVTMNGQQVVSKTIKQSLLLEDADFWRRLVIDTKGSYEDIPFIQSSLNPTLVPVRPTSAPTISPIPSPTTTKPTTNPTEFSTTKESSLSPISGPSFSPSSDSSGPPSQIPSRIASFMPNLTESRSPSSPPTLVPSLKPSFSLAPSESSAPTSTPFPTATTRPTVSIPPSIHTTTMPSFLLSNEPSMSIAPTIISLSPTFTPLPTKKPDPTIMSPPTNTQSKVVSLSPSTKPTSSTCTLSADIACENEDGDVCDFTSPIGEQCIGGNAKEFRFIYMSNFFCMGNNTQASFSCVDETTNVPRSSTVYINIFRGDTTFYEGIVNEGNIFPVPFGDDTDSIGIEIRDLNEGFGPGILLQTMMMSVQCREEDSLALLDTFGSLQLVGYRNEEQGLKTVFTIVSIRYGAINTGRQDLFLTSVVKTTPIVGMEPLLPTGEIILIDPGSSEVFSELFTVNLAAIVGIKLNFSILVHGGNATGEKCEDSDTYTLAI